MKLGGVNSKGRAKTWGRLVRFRKVLGGGEGLKMRGEGRENEGAHLRGTTVANL